MTTWKRIRWSILGLLLLTALLIRFNPGWGEWYAVALYPGISSVLSSFSSLFPFSLGDCFIVAGCCWMAGYLIWILCRRKRIGQGLMHLGEFAVWVYVWFYLAWGLNYFRAPFYERARIERAAYSPEDFSGFLNEYIGALNGAYSLAGDTAAVWYMQPAPISPVMDSIPLGDEIVREYRRIAPRFGLAEPRGGLRVKPMLWSGGMSKVGVSGYMGPFFSEFNLNRDVLKVEYPFTYAHELAHRLGIGSEAEANLYAYRVCSRSANPAIRFSGYFSVLGYVMNNARGLLAADDYKAVLGTVRPEIIRLYAGRLQYWRDKYNYQAGKVQNKAYNLYLKSNRVSAGTKDYSEMVGLLISLEMAEKSCGNTAE